jgi:transcriptional regulator with XRE-family HTH domain
MDVGKRIKQRRKSLGLSAEEVAKKIGVSPATVYRYESADILHMRSDRLRPIAEALGTTPDYLMGWTDDPDGITPEPVEESAEDEDVWAFREAVRRNPDLRVLFKLTRNASTEDVKKAIAIVKMLKGDVDE